jgi:hypothetical protein
VEQDELGTPSTLAGLTKIKEQPESGTQASKTKAKNRPLTRRNRSALAGGWTKAENCREHPDCAAIVYSCSAESKRKGHGASIDPDGVEDFSTGPGLCKASAFIASSLVAPE